MNSVRAILVQCVVLSIIVDLNAAESHIEGKEFILTEHGSTIFADFEGNGKIIHLNSITVNEGYSIKLLPGTHIKTGDELKVSIVSCEYQENLSEQATEEEKKQIVASILERTKLPDISLNAALIFKLPKPAGRRSQLQQQFFFSAVLPIRSQNHTSHVANINRLVNSQSATCIYMHSTNYTVYYPTLSWGYRGEMIAVMRA